MGLPGFGSVSWGGRRADLNFKPAAAKNFSEYNTKMAVVFLSEGRVFDAECPVSSGLSKKPSLARLVSTAD